jgi:hypothetical protein
MLEKGGSTSLPPPARHKCASCTCKPPSCVPLQITPTETTDGGESSANRRKAWASQPHRDEKRDVGWKQSSEVGERENQQAGATPRTIHSRRPSAESTRSTEHKKREPMDGSLITDRIKYTRFSSKSQAHSLARSLRRGFLMAASFSPGSSLSPAPVPRERRSPLLRA